VVCYWTGPDEGDVRDTRVGGKVFGDIRPADDRLDDVRIMSACSECRRDYRGEVAAGPSSVLGALYYDGIAGEDGGNDGGD
jgi:hypothetical protein